MDSIKGYRISAVLGAAVFSAAVLAAGCGSSGSSSSTGSGGNTAAYQASLDKVYKGTYQEPTGNAPAHQTGKNVWVISTGQDIETSQNASAAMEEAGKALGWNVTIYDGQFDPNRWLAGVEQAIAAKADGIVMLYIDCAPVKTALQSAQQANIPVVGIESVAGCNKSLMNWVVNYAGAEPAPQYLVDFGAAQADWVIGKTNGQAKAIVTVETDLETTKLVGQGAKQEFAKCSGCQILDEIDFAGTEIGPPLQGRIEQALIKYPDANSFVAAYDAILTSGGAAALKSSGHVDQIQIMGGEGSSPGIQLIYQHAGNDACIGIPTAWEGDAAIDALIRFFAGQDPSGTQSGIGVQACDINHNLPPEGKVYEAPVDFKAAYSKSWGVTLGNAGL